MLEGRTRGYRHHPLLQRFKALERPVDAVNLYLTHVLAACLQWGHRFDGSKVHPIAAMPPVEETGGQLRRAWRHLLEKLSTRDPVRHDRLVTLDTPEPHPLFRIVSGGGGVWEKSAS